MSRSFGPESVVLELIDVLGDLVPSENRGEILEARRLIAGLVDVQDEASAKAFVQEVATGAHTD